MDHVLPVFLFLSVATFSFFSFLAVAFWSDSRRREREAYYRKETLNRITESPIERATAALEFLRQEDLRGHQKRQEGLKVAGLVTAGVGIGLTIALYSVGERPEFMLGTIPLTIGLALLGYAYLLARRP